jgi:NSS family neurotransmitter:Na+ symporter
VWVAAYGQIFFSLSIAFAIMITYASYLPRRSDLTNNAFIAGFANASFELLAGIGVFAAVGFLAVTQGVAVEDVATDGIGLAFVVFPQIISELPALNGLFGVLFFGSLVIAGLSSLISVTQVYVAAAQEKLGWSRTRAVLVSCGASVVVSLVYATQGGINVLDTVDHFVNNFGIAVIGLVEVVFVAWVIRELERLRGYANRLSDIRLGVWWRVALTTVTPVLLGWMLIDNLRTELAESYGGYPLWFNLAFGVGAATIALVAAALASRGGWHTPDEPAPTPADEPEPALVSQDA